MRITDIQRFCMHDGPGVRTTVFFKGCPLRCVWCHNPETQSFEPQLLQYREKCIDCGACTMCKQATCTACGACAGNCPTNARELVGRDLAADELFAAIQKDTAFYGDNGGVTFSGGECMLQIDALAEILRLCKAHGIHTAVDTAGYVPFAHFEQILPFTDLFLYDIKCFDAATHKQYVGKDNALILSNAVKLLDSGAAVWIRIPVVPAVNDRIEEMQQIKRFLDSHRKPQKIELLPYHAMGDAKYRAMGNPAPAFAVPSEKTMTALRTVFE